MARWQLRGSGQEVASQEAASCWLGAMWWSGEAVAKRWPAKRAGKVKASERESKIYFV